MEQKLFTEILPLYKSKKNHPYAMRIRMRMRDMVDAAALRYAVDITMKRAKSITAAMENMKKDMNASATVSTRKATTAAAVTSVPSLQ